MSLDPQGSLPAVGRVLAGADPDPTELHALLTLFREAGQEAWFTWALSGEPEGWSIALGHPALSASLTGIARPDEAPLRSRLLQASLRHLGALERGEPGPKTNAPGAGPPQTKT